MIGFDVSLEINSDNLNSTLILTLDNVKISAKKIEIFNNFLMIDLDLKESIDNKTLDIDIPDDYESSSTTNTTPTNDDDKTKKPIFFNKNHNKKFTKFPIKVPISIYFDNLGDIGSAVSGASSIAVLALIVPMIAANPVALLALVRLI